MSVSRIALGTALAAITLGSTVAPAGAGVTETGNGAPSGSHYQLNIIGVSKDKSAEMDDTSGRRIFVPLWSKANIYLTEGEFGVVDANATDRDGATFSLPNPDPDADGVTEYSVYARALGTPGGTSTTTTCAMDGVDKVCSTENMVLVRDAGKSRFENVSRKLLYVYADYDGDGDLDLVPLFDDRLEDYFWEYDNKGLKLAQLRFYEHSTDVN